jgi:hypothetical protein
LLIGVALPLPFWTAAAALGKAPNKQSAQANIEAFIAKLL